VDQFFFSGWRKPELYLNRDFQQGTSPLAKGEEVKRCLDKLKTDLDSGNWHANNKHILGLDEYDCGHFFLVVYE
jgi:hypothetical protein